MATQKSYTTVNISRFGFSVLACTFDRVNTDDVKDVVCNLIASLTVASTDDIDYIRDQWKLSLSNEDKFISFSIDAGGDYMNDYHVSLRHYDVTDQERIDAVRVSSVLTHMV